jgi:hypothetical protein
LLPDFVFANFQSIGLRAAMPLSRIWQEQAVFAVPLLALSGGGILFALRMRPGGASREWQLSLAWLLASAFGLFMASTIYFYAYGALVPGAILTALPMFDRRHSWGLVIWSVIILGMVAGYDLPGRISGAREERAALADMARVLAPQVAGQSHCLYVFDGPTALYRLTGSGLPTRLIYPDHLNNALEAKALPVDPAQELERIFAQRPGAVVTSPDPVTVQNPATNAIVSRELATHYRALGRWKFRDRRLDLFARQPDADGLQPPCRRK